MPPAGTFGCLTLCKKGPSGPFFMGEGTHPKGGLCACRLLSSRLMRVATLILLALLAVVQAELWFGKGGVPRVASLQGQLQAQQKDNAGAQARNEQLAAEVRDLQEGLEMVEEKARTELGMVKPDEVFVQLTTRLPQMAPVLTPAAP
jgi:cell division protein FtsB